MFRGKEQVRFCCDQPEVTVRHKVRDALGDLGAVTITQKGDISVRPHAKFCPALTVTTMAGLLHREWNEYEVRIDYACAPSPAGWAVVVAGTPLLLLGWAALLAPLTAARATGAAVREALAEAEDALGGAPSRRYGRKDMRR
jgi:hypothetical protein